MNRKTKLYGVDLFYGIGLGFDKAYISDSRYKYKIYAITILFIRLSCCIRYC
jgi:hypothetical protein